MSSIFVNTLKSTTGNTILIPAGHSLSLDGTVVTNTSLVPDVSGQEGKILRSDGSSLGWGTSGAKNIIQYTSSTTYFPSSGTRLVHVRVIGCGGGG